MLVLGPSTDYLSCLCLSAPLPLRAAASTIEANVFVTGAPLPASSCTQTRRLSPSSSSAELTKTSTTTSVAASVITAAPIQPITLLSSLYAADPYLHALALRKARMGRATELLAEALSSSSLLRPPLLRSLATHACLSEYGDFLVAISF